MPIEIPRFLKKLLCLNRKKEVKIEPDLLKETYEEMVRHQKKQIIQLQFDERFYNRKSLTEKRYQLELGKTQAALKTRIEILAMLEEEKGEYV